ncbi:MAG: 23S rRNA (uracil(1939)-C(5))-methyltransferase RlmD [Lachnospiraceae bacterium]|nr:23S rRNA (uracil(1939)-C(5))-methyltransferase RlmD [Lachnospiraceae bacterium]
MNFNKNDTVVVTIEDMGADGEGIGKVEGFPLFIKDAIIGDTVEAKIVKNKKNYAYARLEKVLSPSPFRVQPVCRFHRQCGGCQLQAMSYERQLIFKQDKVKNNLLRIGGFSETEIDRVMEPIVGMEEPFRYRNKAQYPIGEDKDGNPVAGFYAGRTHSIIANTDCVLGREENKEILDTILAYMREFHVRPYDEKSGEGLIRHVLIRTGFDNGEIMVCLVLNYRKKREGKALSVVDSPSAPREGGGYLPHQEELLSRLSQIKNMTSVSVSINTEKTNVIMGKEIHTLWGKDSISDSIRVRDMTKADMAFTGEKLEFSISPLSFYQVNPRQTEKLYSLALQYAGLTGQETVWDLYCGIGTISLFLATRAKQVCGVEVIPQAIEDAKENARRNHITNAEFFVGKAEEVLPAFYDNSDGCDENAAMRHPDVIVVDPPRKGCDTACLATMLKMAPDRIVYVSCDSATLARDLRILCDGGYELRKVRAVEQFGGTVHVETVALLSHKTPDSTVDMTVEFGEGEGKVPSGNIDKRAEAYKPKEKVTYEMIQEYVEAKYGFKVHTAYIAEVKRGLGLLMNDAPNAVEELKQPRKHPTAEKVEAIKEALRYFGVV